MIVDSCGMKHLLIAKLLFVMVIWNKGWLLLTTTLSLVVHDLLSKIPATTGGLGSNIIFIKCSMISEKSIILLLYSLDSKPGGLLSKRGSRRRTCPLEIHYTQGAYFRGGLTFGRGLTIHTIEYCVKFLIPNLWRCFMGPTVNSTNWFFP